MLDFLTKPVKSPLKATDTTDELMKEEHRKLAAKHGVRAVTAKGSVGEFIRAECIQVYKADKVEKYMDRKGYWSWSALRRKDVNTVGGFIRTHPTRYTSIYGGYTGSVYDKVVPLPVLMTVDKFVERFGDDVSFFVAHLNDKLDPFLSVLDRVSGEVFIVERWDEPGFRG